MRWLHFSQLRPPTCGWAGPSARATAPTLEAARAGAATGSAMTSTLTALMGCISGQVSIRNSARTDSTFWPLQDVLIAITCGNIIAFVGPLTLDSFPVICCRACGTPSDLSGTAPLGPGGCGQLLPGPQCSVHLLSYQWLPRAGCLRILQPGWALLPCCELLSWYQVRIRPCPTVHPQSEAILLEGRDRDACFTTDWWPVVLTRRAT